MSNNTFSGKRFQLLFTQHFIQNAQFLLLSIVAYVGVIFITLCIMQSGNRDAHSLGLQQFQIFMVGFVTVFGILYVGHSFPAFRSKESTISYLMIPASALEKFAFEFVSRIVFILVTLPLLYWLTFNAQGYFFVIFSEDIFEPIGIQYILKVNNMAPEKIRAFYALSTGGVLFVLSLAFTGAAMFTKQPLVKSLFTLAMVVIFFVGYSYIVLKLLGVGEFHGPQSMVLVASDENSGVKALAAAFFAATGVMLFVAFRKLKEREV